MTTVTFSGTGPLTLARVKNTPGMGSARIVIIQGYTSIGIYAFSRCTSLTSVTLGNSVIGIGIYAFSRCTSLSSITIPDSVNGIAQGAFTLSGLTTVYISQATANTLKIAVPATNVNFFGAYPVNTVLPIVPPTITFPNIIATYGDVPRQIMYTSNSTGAVTYTSSNTSVATISGSTITFVGGGSSTITANQAATTNYSSAITTATCTVVTNIVTFTGTGPLTPQIVNAGISSATIVTIQGYTSIGGGAFFLKRQIISVTIGNSVTRIDYDAFGYCSGLTSVTIPISVTSIGEGAFNQCTGLTSVIIPNSVTSIGGFAFYNCTGLTSVIIPDSVTNIGLDAFKGSGLTTVYISQATATTLAIPVPDTNITFFGKYPVTTILLVPPTIIFPSITATYGDAPRQIVYTSNSNGAVTYTSSDTSVATISGSMITFVAPGSSTITATQAATNYYTPGTATAPCSVNANTPSNPVIISNAEGFLAFLATTGTFARLTASISISNSQKLLADSQKTIILSPGVIITAI